MTNFNASSFRFFERKVAQGIALSDFSGSLLYHTKNYQGTTTCFGSPCTIRFIIPYQELPGNYNTIQTTKANVLIIPYQELPGNYNRHTIGVGLDQNYTIPRTTRELQLKYNVLYFTYYYTIPRTTRELQQKRMQLVRHKDYTIPRTTRELQPRGYNIDVACHYTIPRTTRELQLRQGRPFRPVHYTIPRTTRELQRP